MISCSRPPSRRPAATLTKLSSFLACLVNSRTGKLGWFRGIHPLLTFSSLTRFARPSNWRATVDQTFGVSQPY